MTCLSSLRSSMSTFKQSARLSRSSSFLAALLTSHYSRGQPAQQASEYAEQAQQELRWLEEAARARSAKDGSKWEDRLEGMVREMVEQDKPLAYVLGTQPFHPLPIELLVRAPTLIPRPETEHWVSLLSQRFSQSSFASSSLDGTPRRPFRLLDIGTGTGCIALGLTYAFSQAVKGRRAVEALAVDRSTSALELATENAKRCSLFQDPSKPPNSSTPSSSASPHVSLLQADLFSSSFSSNVLSHLANLSPTSPSAPRSPSSPLSPSAEHRFDLVVSNPPYIPLHEYAQLERSVREWEDRGALVGEYTSEKREKGEDDGLIFYRRIVSLLPDLLVSRSDDVELGGKEARPPVLALEVGKGQARAVERMLVDEGFRAEVIEDPWGVERAVFGYAKKG